MNIEFGEICNGYLCRVGKDTWFFPSKGDLIQYVADLIEDKLGEDL